MKTIYDYFEEDIEYPTDVCDNLLPYNTVLSEVSTTLLDGFINYVTPLKCILIDDYVNIDDEIEKDRAHVSDKKDRFNYYYFKGTKRELIAGINSGVIQITHTNLHMFGDDIILLTKIANGKYMWFWYRMSGRCDVGRFKTTDSENEIIESINNWLNEMKEEGRIKGYSNLNIRNFLEGWISF